MLALAPLRGAWLEKITLEDGSEASVTLPLGATEPRPVVIGLHGSGDRPEWSCGEWRGVVDSYAFVVCPHGSPSGNAFVWQSTEQLENRVMSALAAAQARYAPYMMDGPIVLAGFSQGAYLAPSVAKRHADLFPWMALDEGGYWQTAGEFPSAFARGGGKRALLMCSTPNCDAGFAQSQQMLQRSGVDVRVVHLGPFGHTVNDDVIAAIKPQFQWLVRDDARWAPWLNKTSSR